MLWQRGRGPRCRRKHISGLSQQERGQSPGNSGQASGNVPIAAGGQPHLETIPTFPSIRGKKSPTYSRRCYEVSQLRLYLRGFPRKRSRSHVPPLGRISGLVDSTGFSVSRRPFRRNSLFHRAVGYKRAHGQGYHDRSMLHYRKGLKLPERFGANSWRSCTKIRYQSFLHRMFCDFPRKRFLLTFDWYYAWQGSAPFRRTATPGVRWVRTFSISIRTRIGNRVGGAMSWSSTTTDVSNVIRLPPSMTCEWQPP